MDHHALLGDRLSSTPSRNHCGDGSSKGLYYENRRRDRLHGVWVMSVANLVLLVLQTTMLALHVAGRWGPTTGDVIQATYGFDIKYMTLDHGYDWLWDERAIERAGAVAVSQDEDGEVTEYGIISMFHELHCIASIRTAFQNAYEGGQVAFNHNEDPHWPHCLHYLHQMIICKADGLIEKQQLWNNTLPYISGAEDVRQCKNAQPLFDLFREKGA